MGPAYSPDMMTTRLGWALAIVLAVLLAPLGGASSTRYQAGSLPDPGLLKVKVKKIEDSLSAYDSALMTLEVSNPTDLWAEPIEFYVPTKKRKDVKGLHVPRVEPPFGLRNGRAIAPHGKLVYVIGVGDMPKRLSKSKVRVTRASFFADGSLLEPPVVVGELGEAEPGGDYQGDTTRFSTVMLRNTTDRTVDAILLADFKLPRSGEALVRLRLAPQEERRCTVEGPQVRFTGQADLRGSVLQSIELVDWSSLVESAPENSRGLLEAAYGARTAWPDPAPLFTAQYTVAVEGFDFGAQKRLKREASGTCASREGGGVNFMPGQGQPQLVAVARFDRATRWLAHEPFGDWLGTGKVWLHSMAGKSAVVAVLHPRAEAHTDKYYWIEDGQIVGEGSYPLHGSKSSFTLRSLGGGTVIVQEDIAPVENPSDPYHSTERFEYGMLGDVPIPVAMDSIRRFNPESNNEVTRLELDEIQLVGVSQSEPIKTVPSGELADEVRAAWEHGYRMKGKPFRLRGHLHMTNAGNDGMWRGVDEVEGEFLFEGFDGRAWKSAKIELQGNYTEEATLALEEVVRDRFGMYLSRDWSARLSFDDEFIGAEFEQSGSKILVRGNTIVELEIKRGRVVSFTRGADRRQLSWKTKAGVDLLVGVKRGDEQILFQREQVDGVWLASGATMTDVFPDWGPEVVELSKLSIEHP